MSELDAFGVPIEPTELEQALSGAPDRVTMERIRSEVLRRGTGTESAE